MTGNEATLRRKRPVAGPAWPSRPRSPRRRWIAGAFAVIGLVAARQAGASGFLNPRLADPHGHPALANPYAVYFNPGALGGSQGTQIVVDGTFVFRTMDYNRSASALSPNATRSSLSDPTYVSA